MKKVFFIIVLLSVLGLLDAGYLTYEHYAQIIPPCSLHAWFSDCGAVLTSKYAMVLGIPVSAFGVVYYIFVSIFSLLMFWKNTKIILSALSVLVTLGSITALYFIFLQLFVLHAICPYCMLSHINTLLIAVLVSYYVIKHIRVEEYSL